MLLPLLLLLLARGAAAEGEIVTARLAWEPGGVGGFSPGRIPFRAEPPEGVAPLVGLTNARYARIKMAGTKGLNVALDAVAGAPRLWVDHDFDGDFQDEQQSHMQKSGTGWFRRQVVLAHYADETEAVPLPLYFSHLPSNGDDYVTVYAQIHRRGTVVLGGRLRLVALTDHSFDVCFDDAKRDRIWIDLDGDGDFQWRGDAPERVRPGEPFRVGEEGWTAQVTSASGLAVEFRRARTVPPAKPRAWPEAVAPTAGITRNPPAESLDVLAKRFEEEKSKAYVERYGTVNLIGDVGTRASLSDLLLRIADTDKELNIQNAALRALGNKAYLAFGAAKVAARARQATSSAAHALARRCISWGTRSVESIYIDMIQGSDTNAVSGAARWLAFTGTDRARKAILAVVEGAGRRRCATTPTCRGPATCPAGRRSPRSCAPPTTTTRTSRPKRSATWARSATRRPASGALALAAVRPVQITIGTALADVLGAAGDAKAVAALLGFLDDAKLHANVREKVLEQLRFVRAPESLAVLIKALRAKEPGVRAVAAEVLAAVPHGDVTAALLKQAKREKDPEVLPLLLEALGDHGNEIALPHLLKTARGRSKTEARRAAIRALARLGFHHPKVRTYLIGLLASRNWEDRILALDAAGASGDPALVVKVLPALEHDAWQVRLACVEALDTLRTKACIEPLIRRLGVEEEERVRDAIASTLFRLTGMNLYDSAEIWQRWWKENADGFEVPTQIPQPPEQHAGTQAGFYGIPVKSERVIFVIDQSGSMSAAGDLDAEDDEKSLNRLDVAVREVLGAIAKLKNSARVNVILFHTTIHPWKDKLQKLGSGTRTELRKELASKKPTGGTNLYDGLELALQTKDVDTVFLLSDGVPGSGKYVATPDILRAVRRENQTRRVAIHCVSIGMDSELLRLLAEENGGRYARR